MCNKCSETVEWKMTQIISWITIPHWILLSKYNYHSFQYSNGFTAPNLCWWHCSRTQKTQSSSPSLNLISASFGESERARERVWKSLTFFSSGPSPESGIHGIMSKTGRRQAGEAESLLSDRDSPGERTAALIWKCRENITRKRSSFFIYSSILSAQGWKTEKWIFKQMYQGIYKSLYVKFNTF